MFEKEIWALGRSAKFEVFLRACINLVCDRLALDELDEKAWFIHSAKIWELACGSGDLVKRSVVLGFLCQPSDEWGSDYRVEQKLVHVLHLFDSPSSEANVSPAQTIQPIPKAPPEPKRMRLSGVISNAQPPPPELPPSMPPLAVFSEFKHLTQPLIGGRKLFHALRSLPSIISSDSPVLILGETGTGKDVVARTIHELGPRKNKPFTSLNCAAIPKDLVEAEIFGHTRHAFTGASDQRRGRLGATEDGTIFFDEIVRAEPLLQTKLLKVLEEGVYWPVGSDKAFRTSARMIAAAGRTLLDLQRKDGPGLQPDFFYRFPMVIQLPGLRERPEDIPLLVDHFLTLACLDETSHRFSLTDRAMDKLMNYGFPGNVRELKHVIERAVMYARQRDQKEIETEDIEFFTLPI